MDHPWLTTAKSLIGVREVPGPGNSKTILGWAQKLGAKVLGISYTADSTAWCGLFVAHCIATAGLKPPLISVRAKSWASWGDRAVFPCLGCVLVFERPGGGHVGFYAGEDATNFYVLGGNQSDAVNITKIAKSRMIAARWPKGVYCPLLKKTMNSKAPVSTNEA